MKITYKFLSALLWCFLGTSLAHAKEEACMKSFTGVTSVLVDISDPLDSPARLAYEKLIDRILDEVPDNARIDIYRITLNTEVLGKPLFSSCKPAPTSFTSGKIYWDRKRLKVFYKPSKEALYALAEVDQVATTSPILESIYNISLTSFAGNEDIGLGKLVVISDFMQNTQLISFYKGNVPKYTSWRSSPEGRSWVRKFNNAHIEAVVIPRSGKNSLSISGRDFFVNYFQQNFKCMIWHDLAASTVKEKNGCK